MKDLAVIKQAFLGFVISEHISWGSEVMKNTTHLSSTEGTNLCLQKR